METQMQAESQPRAASANQDDRIWVAIVHGSAFLVFFGPIIPVILWFTHRKKSAYVAFQALQAMIYQSLFLWTWVLLIPLLSSRFRKRVAFMAIAAFLIVCISPMIVHDIVDDIRFWFVVGTACAQFVIATQRSHRRPRRRRSVAALP